VTDGLVINAGDRLHESRLWMVHERKGVTGLGLTLTSPQSSSDASAACAYTSVTFVRWDGPLRIESASGYCQCYQVNNGLLTDAGRATCQ
jgi:hypothetical protein